MRPQPDLMRACAPEDNREAGAPCASTDDGDLAHSVLRVPKRLSVPASRRRMFALCLTMISTDVNDINTSATGTLPYSWRTNVILEKAAAAAIDPRET